MSANEARRQWNGLFNNLPFTQRNNPPDSPVAIRQNETIHQIVQSPSDKEVERDDVGDDGDGDGDGDGNGNGNGNGNGDGDNNGTDYQLTLVLGGE